MTSDSNMKKKKYDTLSSSDHSVFQLELLHEFEEDGWRLVSKKTTSKKNKKKAKKARNVKKENVDGKFHFSR